MHSRTARRRRLAVALLALVLVPLTLTLTTTATVAADRTASPPTADRPDGADGELMLVLDSSGSMAEPDASGSTKIAAAKQALTTVIGGLPDEAPVGLRVFGASVFDRSDPGACTDSQQVVPVGPRDRAAMTTAVRRYEPYGETPISHALREAADDLGATGPRTVVLVSDGEATCPPEPCAVAGRSPGWDRPAHRRGGTAGRRRRPPAAAVHRRRRAGDVLRTPTTRLR